MSDRQRNAGISGESSGLGDTVCIHTNKVYDSCRDKDCVEDVRVYLTQSGQDLVERALNVKVRNAEIIWVFSDIEPVQFNRGYYTVDLKYFFRITLDVFTSVGKPTTVEGLSSFDKRVILYGSEGNAKIFRSKYAEDAFDSQMWQKTNMPVSVVEVVDPVALAAKLVDVKDGCCCVNGYEQDIASIPQCVSNIFDGDLVICNDCRRVYVSLGVFSIVKLERKVQLLIPACDFCVPEKECVSAAEDDPCDLFDKFQFPMDEFFPPERPNDSNNRGCGCNCGC